MMESGIRISAKAPLVWLRQAIDIPGFREIEVSAQVLADTEKVIEIIEMHGLDVRFTPDLMPADVAAYLVESPVANGNSVSTHLGEAVKRCRRTGARYASLDVGLNRINAARVNEGIALRVALIAQVLPAVVEAGMVLCLPVRCPRCGAGAHEWEYAVNVIHEVSHRACRLGVNLYPAELPPDFSVSEFVRSSCFQVGVLRFHYAPHFGEDMTFAQHEEWSQALKRHGFDGVVSLCPEARSLEGIRQVLVNAVAWSALYR